MSLGEERHLWEKDTDKDQAILKRSEAIGTIYSGKPNCSQCPLKNQQPMMSKSTQNKAPKLLILGDCPSKREIEQQKHYKGAAGWILAQSLRKHDLSLAETHKTHLILCRPPEGKKLPPKDWKQAIACCAPRLEAELVNTDVNTILALGDRALRYTTGLSSVSSWFGAPLRPTPTATGAARTILPCPHPTQAISNAAWIPVIDQMVKRAIDLANDNLPEWGWAKNLCFDAGMGPHVLIDMIGSKEPIAIDVETGGLDPQTSPLICIGLSTGTSTISLMWPPLSYEIKLRMKRLLGDPGIVKIFHNAQHDALTLKQNGMPIRGEIFDTMLAHAIVAPQLKHDLGFVAACTFAAPRWKSEFRAEYLPSDVFTDAVRDHSDKALALRRYNAKDAEMTARLYSPLCKQLDKTHNGWELYNQLMAMSYIAMDMREHGAQIDTSTFAEHEKNLAGVMNEQRTTFNQLCETQPVLPRLGVGGGHPDLRKFFYRTLGITPRFFSKITGEASLDNNALERIITDEPPAVKEIAQTVLKYRKAHKLLSTYVQGLDLDVSQKIHPQFKVYGTVTGRWSSAGPNFQNWPKQMRNMVTSRFTDGYIVEADFSQLELRIMAVLAKDKKLLAWYANGVDVHTETAKALFGGLSSDPKVRKMQRDVAKTIEYGFNYNSSADVTTVWRSISLKCPDITMAQVQFFRKKWFIEHPAIAQWQIDQLRFAEENSYIEEPLSGRREYFHDGRVDSNKVLNFPVQGFAGTLMNRAVLKAAKSVDWKNTYIIAQVHDALYLDTNNPKMAAELLSSSMTQEVEGMLFPVDIHIGRNMKDSVDLAVWLENPSSI